MIQRNHYASIAAILLAGCLLLQATSQRPPRRSAGDSLQALHLVLPTGSPAVERPDYLLAIFTMAVRSSGKRAIHRSIATSNQNPFPAQKTSQRQAWNERG